MTVIKKKTLDYYCSLYPSIESAVSSWYTLIKLNTYWNIVELRHSFPTGDPIANNKLICFNIKGNTYRLIVRIAWGKTVFVQELLTHAEYTKKYVGG